MLAFVTDVASNYFSWEVFAGVQEALYPVGYDFLALQWSPETRDENRFLESIVDRRVEGVLVFPSPRDYHYLVRLEEHNIPIVTVDRKIIDPPSHFVGSDDYNGAFTAVEYLIDQGHHRIIYIGAKKQKALSSNVRRYEGYRDAMLKHQFLPLPMKSISGEPGHSDVREELLATAINTKNRPTAVFACNDIIAGDLFAAFIGAGYSIPNDLSVVGFGDLPLSKYLHPRLTTVHQDPRSIGREAGKLLVKLLEQKHNKDTVVTMPREDIQLPTELIVRESTAPPATAQKD
jgi:LacI family transcriptional regulator